MHYNIKYVVALLIILVFTSLAVSLEINRCGSVFAHSCQSDSVYKKMAALMGTALAFFIISIILSCISTLKNKKWIIVCDFFTVTFGAVLVLAALCIYYRGKQYWAPLMGGIAMTAATETAIFILLDLFV